MPEDNKGLGRVHHWPRRGCYGLRAKDDYTKRCDEVRDWVNNVEDVEPKYKIVNSCDLGDVHEQTDPKIIIHAKNKVRHPI